MSIGKIFKVLIVAVGCVIAGAVILNVLLPNAMSAVSNAIETQIYKATGIQMDFNGDGYKGAAVNNSKETNNDQRYNSGTNNGISGFGEVKDK